MWTSFDVLTASTTVLNGWFYGNFTLFFVAEQKPTVMGRPIPFSVD